MTIREMLCERERSVLSPYAARSDKSKGRQIFIEPCSLRTEFQRDRDRITHSKAFRRLMYKTQVFLSPEADHYRTRLTHTLEVTQIARTIARALNLNEDLCEAIGLGHDLGHTPFGHAGERVLQRCYDENFSHNAQSLRVADKLEKLNLTFEVRDGIVNHVWRETPCTLEGKIVQYSDRIAYINHDIDDACRAGVMKESDIPDSILSVLGYNHSDRINTMVTSIIRASTGTDTVTMEIDVKKATMDLRELLFELVYKNPIAKGEEGKAEEMLHMMFDYFCKYPEKLPSEYLPTLEEEGVQRAVCDYISGMTDRYAVSKFNEIFVPESWGSK
ncbi:MAG: deoxyguanosinetriphosphate triphosphohydrolase [Ruminococcaceae bacterium]|nr:deoxyguanosinetriphosphate triphosphohydrolase [Oscillospiraceae bacterium]